MHVEQWHTLIWCLHPKNLRHWQYQQGLACSHVSSQGQPWLLLSAFPSTPNIFIDICVRLTKTPKGCLFKIYFSFQGDTKILFCNFFLNGKFHLLERRFWNSLQGCDTVCVSFRQNWEDCWHCVSYLKQCFLYPVQYLVLRHLWLIFITCFLENW